MASLAKAYCHQMHHNIPFHHYRPSNLQNPISLFALTSPTSSSSPSISPTTDPPNKQPQFGHLIIPTIALAASAWFFVRLHQNLPIIVAPMDSSSPLELEEEEEEGAIKELPLQNKPDYVKALHFYRIKPGTVLKLIDVYDSDNYESLKARIRLSVEWLESARKEFEEVVEKDPGRVMEYSHFVDELMEILRDMEDYIDKCEKEKVKGYLRSCNRLLARVRKMEAQILNVLREFQEDEEGGGET